MKIRLKDIIDLDYFITMDSSDSEDDIRSRTARDRMIYNKCSDEFKTDKSLLLDWLAFRKEEYYQEKGKDKLALLPGTIFSLAYKWIAWALLLSGGIAGISLAYSFLAYHGTRPVNVAVFIAFFVVFQVILIFFTLVFLGQRLAGGKNQKKTFRIPMVHSLVAGLFFNLSAKIFKKSPGVIEYKDMFFWPIFILTSLFAFGFSAGSLGITFFRVIVSDMAFGWQSTLMTTSKGIHDLVSFMALPWSWFVPLGFAHPDLAQIEGSRIILKEGIMVLATKDLVSWWPFICLSILFYAVIPRLCLLFIGVMAQSNVRNLHLKRPGFRQLIVRMQSPVMDIDAGKSLPIDSMTIESLPIDSLHDSSSREQNDTIPGTRAAKNKGHKSSDRLNTNALILASKNVYTNAAIEKVIGNIRDYLFFNIKELIDISFDYEKDMDAVMGISNHDIGQVILVQEVWQPPIRGLLHYILKIKAAMPEEKSLLIMLTGDADREDLFIKNNDINYEVWKKAVFKLENPDIVVKRFIKS